jgi:putative photosynthetic complex assembly protein
MSDHAERPVPRTAIAGAGLLVVAAIAVSGVARWGDVGRVEMPRTAAVETRDLRFEDRAGAVVVLAAEDGREVAVLAPGTNGFIRGVLRGLARERRMSGTGREPPFQLVRRTDGRLSLVDPTTGRQVELDAFGPTNVEAFAKLLHTGERQS